MTINADGHEVFGRMNAPDHEKRKPVILPISAQELCPYGSLKDAEQLLVRYPAELLQATPRESAPAARREPKTWQAVPDMLAPEWHAAEVEAPQRRAGRTAKTSPPSHRPPEHPGPTTGDLF